MRLLVTALSCAILSASTLTAQEIHVTWNGSNTSLDSYPSELSTARNVDTIITQINDYVYEYSQTLQGTPQASSGSDDLINIIVAGASDTTKHFVPNTCTVYKGKVDALLTKLSGDINLTPKNDAGKIPSVTLADSQNAYRTNILPLLTDLGEPPASAAADPVPADCAAAAATFNGMKPQLEKLATADKGQHTKTGTADLSPGYDYKLTINETYGGIPTEVSPRQFTFSPTNNAITVSAGVGLTWLQSRSYMSVVVPDPATSATATKNVLVVGDTGAPRPVILALLNYTIFAPHKHDLADFNVAISAGPILQAGGKSDLSTLGFFSGVSISFLHNLYITPGVHVGQYAGPPAGLTAGGTIPDGLGTLAPVKSYQPSFSLGITFRTASIGAKKVVGEDTSTAK